MLRLIVDKAQSLKEFTDNNYAQASFFWNRLLKDKEIKVNGKRVEKDLRLTSGDEVCYYLTPKQAEKAAFYTVYEDDNVLVVDKESGVNSEAVYADLTRRGEFYFIHRLDRNTKGLLIFAKTASAESALLNAFRQKRVEKIYHALCFGTFPKTQEVLTAYLKKDAVRAEVKIYDKPLAGGEKICTEYRVLEVLSDLTTVVEVVLHTGKTHQIRAHLAYIGCPIVGDTKYGDKRANSEKKSARQHLVAKRLHLQAEGVLAYLNNLIWESRFDVREG